MRLAVGNITSLASEGRLTLQLPMYSVSITNPSAANMQLGEIQQEDYPDEWFCYLQSNNTPCTGKQEGYLYLTKAGFEANKEDIKAAFEAAIADGTYDRTNGEGWPAFERHAQEHFAKVEKQRQRKANELRRKLDQLISFNV